MVDELNTEHLDLMVLFEAAHIDVIAFRDVKKDTVDEEEERFDVEKLAPAEAEVEEKLSQPLIVNALPIQLVYLPLLSESTQLASLV